MQLRLICLSNMENLNAVFINDGIPQELRLEKLNKIAIQQMGILEDVRKKIAFDEKNLPTPEKSIQQIEKEQMKLLKEKAKAGKLMLDE